MFEFLGYTATPNEKHLGIASVKYMGKIVLRYKIVPKKDGSAWFPNAASYKIVENGEDRYTAAFMLDSHSESEDMMNFIRKHVTACMKPQQSAPVASSYSSNDDLPF